MGTQVHKIVCVLGVILTVITIPGSLFSQQVIRFKSGNEYEVKILYRSQDTVRYYIPPDTTIILTALMTQVESIREGHLPPASDEERAVLLKQYKTNRTIKNIGLGVFAGGLAVSAVGLGMGLTNLFDEEMSKSVGITVLAGVSMVVTGGIMAIIGGTNAANCRRKIDGFSVDIRCSPQQSDLVLRFRF